MNCFALCKLQRHIAAVHNLSDGTDQMHFDPPFLFIVKSVMLEKIGPEICAEQPVQVKEYIAVECCRDAGGVIIGRRQDCAVFMQVYPDENQPPTADQTAHSLQEIHGVSGFKIANG